MVYSDMHQKWPAQFYDMYWTDGSYDLITQEED